ncbi:hypothetical protein HDU84_004370 [Entophlyctis sp. JEL0112]|nr:hypothetical protein HDU84_004370 [Entophlyctis sp. JEL0112]
MRYLSMWVRRALPAGVPAVRSSACRHASGLARSVAPEPSSYHTPLRPAPRGVGRKPRSVRDTAPDMHREESRLLQVHLDRAEQSHAAAESSDVADADPVTPQPRKRKIRKFKLNPAKLSSLSGHEKIELFRQLLAGGPEYLNDAKVLYELIDKNGIINRLKYNDFHNIFRLLCSQKQADAIPSFVIRVWNDWANVDGEHLKGAYSIASYVIMIRIAVNWGDRELSRILWESMTKENLVSELPVETFNQLLKLFTEPVFVHPERYQHHQLQERNVVSSEHDREPENSYHRRPDPPTTRDLDFASTQILPRIPAFSGTLTTHERIMRLHGARRDLGAVVAAYSDACKFAKILRERSGMLALSLHVDMRAACTMLDLYSRMTATGLSKDLVPRVINNDSMSSVSQYPENVLNAVFNEIVGAHGLATRLSAFFLTEMMDADAIEQVASSSDKKMQETLRNDATKLLSRSLRVLVEDPLATKGDIERPKVVKELLRAFYKDAGCRLDPQAVVCLMKGSLYFGGNRKFSDITDEAEKWMQRGLLWFSDSTEIMRLIIVLLEVYGSLAPRTKSFEQLEALREKILALLENTLDDSEDIFQAGSGKKSKKENLSRELALAGFDALDRIEIIGSEKKLLTEAVDTRMAGEREGRVRKLLDGLL